MMLEEESFSLQQPAEETERCRDYVVTKAAFVRKSNKETNKKKMTGEKISYICIFLYDMLSFCRFFFFVFLNQTLQALEGKNKNTGTFFPPFKDSEVGSWNDFGAWNFRSWECCGLEGTTSAYLDARHHISLSAIVQPCSTMTLDVQPLVLLGHLAKGWTLADTEQNLKSISSDFDWLSRAYPEYWPVDLMGCADWPELSENAWWLDLVLAYSDHRSHQKMGCGASRFKGKANVKAP